MKKDYTQKVVWKFENEKWSLEAVLHMRQLSLFIIQNKNLGIWIKNCFSLKHCFGLPYTLLLKHLKQFLGNSKWFLYFINISKANFAIFFTWMIFKKIFYLQFNLIHVLSQTFWVLSLNELIENRMKMFKIEFNRLKQK